MKIAISGSTGFIGSHLVNFLQNRGVEVYALKYSDYLAEQRETLKHKLIKCNAVINLAGRSIHCRWTASNKKEIRESRVRTTRSLVDAINELDIKPSVFISISAVGIYNEQEVWREEEGEYDNGFLAHTCKRWEAEARKISPDVRLVIARLGIVLGKDGGAYPHMSLPFKYYLGGQYATGHQGFSWIHIDDLIEAFWKMINDESIKDVVHCTTPQICNNLLFTYTLARIIHRPALLRIPTFIFKLLYGEGYVMMTEGQKVFPQKLLNAHFDYEYPDLRSAIKELTFTSR